MAPLAGKHVLIIGGSSGLGFGTARAALAEGAVVTIASSSDTKLRAAAAKLDGQDKVRTEVVNVADEESVKALFEKLGSVDHLIYTPGDEILGRDSSNMDLTTLKSTMDVRYWGFVLCARYGKAVIKDSITVTAGTLLIRPMPGLGEYAGLPGAISSAARGYAIDLAPIRVNCLAFGFIRTEMWDVVPAEQLNAFIEVCAKLPVRHVGTVEEAAEAYLFAMKCTFLTGQTFFIDGGSTII